MSQQQFNNNSKFTRLYRYARTYGMRRAIIKAVGRMRLPFSLLFLLAPLKRCKQKDIAMIGCGQFAFSTIAFVLTKRFGGRIGFCMDIDHDAAASFAKSYNVPKFCIDQIDQINFDEVKLAYIASNHASHTDYATFFLKRGVNVYIEKPISVSKEQLAVLKEQVRSSSANVYFGYNRPFSAAIQELKTYIRSEAITLNCTVIGHMIASDHWYRKPDEGTRVCGNLGHWIDLAIHLLNLRGGVKLIDITIAYADKDFFDDNLTVIFTTDKLDLITLTLTAREEPFEGINESIVFQQNNLFVKIDDFRRAEFQRGPKKHTRTYMPKDVGHERAIMQPFSTYTRDVDEVFLSTDLMLHIMEMVKNKSANSVYKIN